MDAYRTTKPKLVWELLDDLFRMHLRAEAKLIEEMLEK